MNGDSSWRPGPLPVVKLAGHLIARIALQAYGRTLLELAAITANSNPNLGLSSNHSGDMTGLSHHIMIKAARTSVISGLLIVDIQIDFVP